MELKSFVSIKQVDKKHQLKEDFVLVASDKKSLKIFDPYQGKTGYTRIPEQKANSEFLFKCDKIFETSTSSAQLS